MWSLLPFGQPYVRIDYQYVTIVNSPEPVATPAHPFGWYSPLKITQLRANRPTWIDSQLASRATAVANASRSGNPVDSA